MPARAPLLLLILVAVLCAAAEEPPAARTADVETLPAVRLEPSPPRAGAALRVILAPDLLVPGRILELRDGARDRLLDSRVLGRLGLDSFLFQLPPDLRTLELRLLDGDLERLRWPASPVLPVAAAPPATAAPDQGDGAAPAEAIACGDLAPRTEAGREALLAWLAACPLDSALLRNRDLRGVDLAGRNLHRADLGGADLADATLTGADLGAATLLGARLDGADFSGANLEIADLGHASLFVADFAAANLRGADLRGVTATSTSFANADLTGARLAGATLIDVDFTGATCPDGTRTLSTCDTHLELP